MCACVCIRLYVYAPVCESRALQLVFYCLHLQAHTHHFRWLFAPSLSMRAALQQQSRLALVYSHLKLPPQRKPTSPTSAVFSKSETTCIFHFDSQRVAELTGFPMLIGNSFRPSHESCRRANELLNLLSFAGGAALACGNAACAARPRRSRRR